MTINSGALAALATALAWTVTAISFEYAGKRIGAFALNFLRLAVGCLFLGIYGIAFRGRFFPSDAPLSAWIGLGASGLVGLVVGDLLLFQAFIDSGSRVAMLIYATAPAMTAMMGFFLLGERISPEGIGGMALTLAGIALAVLGRGPGRAGPGRKTYLRGIALAFGATLGQAAGLILGKSGAGTMDPFAGTQIRVTAGVLGFLVIMLLTRSFRGLASALKDRKALAGLSLGSFFGPFLGVSLSLLAVQKTSVGIASAVMSITPILIIAPSAIFLKEKVTLREISGSILAVAGVFVLFLA
jgi:drug/metabolite transporter (DMT)-like permease